MLTADPSQLPRLPGQQADVLPGSPTAVLALFSEITRERFRAGNNLAWVWSDNATPQEDEAGDLDEPRKILIEPMFSDGATQRNHLPAIYIGKGPTIANPVAIGNFAGQHLPSGTRAFYAIASIPLEVEILGGTPGESATLADIVWFYFLAGREQIQSTFGLHSMGLPLLGGTGPEEKDRTVWSTKVSFEIQIPMRWSTVPISPLLNDIVLRIRNADETNPDVYLLTQYLR